MIGVLIIGLLLVTHYQQQKQMQMMTVVVLGVVYAGWGIMHHKLHHSVRPKIVLEYVAVAALGVAAIFFILRSVL